LERLGRQRPTALHVATRPPILTDCPRMTTADGKSRLYMRAHAAVRAAQARRVFGGYEFHIAPAGVRDQRRHQAEVEAARDRECVLRDDRKQIVRRHPSTSSAMNLPTMNLTHDKQRYHA